MTKILGSYIDPDTNTNLEISQEDGCITVSIKSESIKISVEDFKSFAMKCYSNLEDNSGSIFKDY